MILRLSEVPITPLAPILPFAGTSDKLLSLCQAAGEPGIDGGIRQSVKYGLRRLVITRTDESGEAINWSGLGGPLASQALANTYLPDEERTVRQTAESSLNQIDPNWAQSEVAQRAAAQLEEAMSNRPAWVRAAGSQVIAHLRRLQGETARSASTAPTRMLRRLATATFSDCRKRCPNPDSG